MKFVLSIEVDNVHQLRLLLDALTNFESAALTVKAQARPNGDASKPHEPEKEPEKAPETPKAARGRPKKEAAPAPAPEPSQPQLEPMPASAPAPSQILLKDLVIAVTDAVRKAQRGEADRGILDLLANFKSATGLDFVMNATEEHKFALIELLRQAKVPLPA